MGEIMFMLVPFAMSVGLIAIVFLILHSIRKRGDSRTEYL